MTWYPPLLHDKEEVTEIGDELEAECAEVEKLKASKNLCRLGDMEDDVSSGVSINLRFTHDMERICNDFRTFFPIVRRDMEDDVSSGVSINLRFAHLVERIRNDFGTFFPIVRREPPPIKINWELAYWECSILYREAPPPLIGGRRVVDAIVVSAVTLLSFVYLYLIGYIDRGGSRGGSSSSLDFRDIYISIILFQAAYVWIKFRDVIPRGAVYRRPNSNKFEPRIKFPVTRGVGVKSKRIPLPSYDTSNEAEVAYRIAAFYCNKPRHRVGQLDLGGGVYFTIPTLSVDPNLPYEEQVNQVGDQVLKVYAEFEKQKTSMNLPPPVPGLALEMPTGEGEPLTTSPIQQPREPLNSGMDLAVQGQGSQPAPNIHNGVDFNNPSPAMLAKTQHELLEAHKQIDCLKAQVAQMEVENMGWEVKHSELKRKYLELEQKNSELEREKGPLNHQTMQSQLESLHPEQDFNTNGFPNMGCEELAR